MHPLNFERITRTPSWPTSFGLRQWSSPIEHVKKIGLSSSRFTSSRRSSSRSISSSSSFSRSSSRNGRSSSGSRGPPRSGTSRGSRSRCGRGSNSLSCSCSGSVCDASCLACRRLSAVNGSGDSPSRTLVLGDFLPPIDGDSFHSSDCSSPSSAGCGPVGSRVFSRLDRGSQVKEFVSLLEEGSSDPD